MYDDQPIDPNLPLKKRLAIEASRNIYKKLSALSGEGFNWQHHPQEFLPANVCCDIVGQSRFMKVLREAIEEAYEKQGIKE